MGHDGAGLRGVLEKEGHAESSVSKIPAAGLLVLWQAESGVPSRAAPELSGILGDAAGVGQRKPPHL